MKISTIIPSLQSETLWSHAFHTALIVLFAGFVSIQAQNGEGGETPSPIKSRMSVSVLQEDDDMIKAQAKVRARIDKRYIGLADLEVIFSNSQDSVEIELGKAITDGNGIASLLLPASKFHIDTANSFHITASFLGTNEYDPSDDGESFVRAQINLEPIVEDSMKTVQVALKSGGMPVLGETIGLFVESYLNPLKVGEGKTDKKGIASISFPTDLPGDPNGDLKIFARLDDHSDFGTVESRTVQPWGIRSDEISDKSERTLYSTDPPLWLLLAFIAILVFIWGHYLEVIYKMIRMRKKTAA